MEIFRRTSTLTGMNDCIFCKVISGELPSYKIYEDENVYVFLDIHPVSPGHTLVIPKKHLPNIYELDDETVKSLSVAVRDTSITVKKAMEADGINIIMNNDGAAGQIIQDHAHIHVIPRYENDGLKDWPSNDLPKERMDEILEKIKNAT